MTVTAWRRRATLLLLVPLLGCGSTPPIRHFVLASLTTPATPSAAAPVVVVREVRLPAYLDRQALVLRDGAHRVVVSNQDRWAGDLRQDLTRLLAENLGHQLARATVVTSPHRRDTPTDFHLDVEVARFERDRDHRVTLAARWFLRQDRNALPIASEPVNLSMPTDDATTEAQVAAMSQAWGELARRVAKAIDAASPAQ